MNVNKILSSINNSIQNDHLSRDEKLFEICKILTENVSHYNWVGFYFANHDTKTLHLGPYVGEATDHTIIPFGKGICGQVALSNKNFIVPDVSKQDNYLACSLTVKSEIVIPIFVNNINIGQLDIDSHEIDPFTKADTELLEAICLEISKLY